VTQPLSGRKVLFILPVIHGKHYEDDTRDYLRKVGKPLHVSKILGGIGKEVTRDSKVSMSGFIAAYVRKNQFFTRIAPNVFGLKEFDEKEKEVNMEEKKE
jgi:hypothetical protein